MNAISHSFYAMGSACSVLIWPPHGADGQPIAEAAEREVRRIEGRYSRFRPDSVMARLNAAALIGADVDLDEETAQLIALAIRCFNMTGGAFDISSGILRRVWDFSRPSLPEPAEVAALVAQIGLEKLELNGRCLRFSRPGLELDLGGLGKEYATDRVVAICRAFDVEHGLVDLGGDIAVIGSPPGEDAWRIAIRDPADPDMALTHVALTEGAIATSGNYLRYIEVEGRRYGHILDPRTGWPARGLASVTVIAERCLVAGALATAAIVKGRDGGVWLNSLGVRHILVDDEQGYGVTEPSPR